mmetsp:Transcript_77589/g.147587  ORF Transcript_77589/g.147587 Transcript_77589/m.147587 type:complete len:201 (-) Transcript_77589:46-648(-)
MLKLGDPLHSDKPCTHDQDPCFLFVQGLDLIVLIENVPAASFEKPLVKLWPTALRACLLMNCGKPQRLAPFVKRPKIAAGANDTEVKIDDLLGCRKHWLDCACLLRPIQLCDLTPDELATHATFNDWLHAKCQRIQMLWLHIGTKHSGGVLKILLCIDNGHQVVVRQVPGAAQSSKTATNDQDTTMCRRWWHHCFVQEAG